MFNFHKTQKYTYLESKCLRAFIDSHQSYGETLSGVLCYIEKSITRTTKPDFWKERNLLLRSFLYPIFFLTNWITNTENRFGYIAALYARCYEMNYLELYDTYKSFYQHVIRFNDPDLEIFKSETSKWMKLLPFPLRKRVKDIFSDARHDKIKPLRVINSWNQSKKGMGPLHPARVISSVVNSMKSLCQKRDNTVSELQEFFLELATDIVVPIKSYEEIAPILSDMKRPTKHATYELTNTNGGGYSVLSLLDNQQYPVNKLEYNNLIRSLDPNHNDARLVLLFEPNKLRLLTVQGLVHQASVINWQKYMTECWKNTPFSTMEKSFELKFMDLFNENKDDFHYSADYTEATNLFKGSLTYIIQKRAAYNSSMDLNTYNQVLRCLDFREFNIENITIPNLPKGYPLTSNQLKREIHKSLFTEFHDVVYSKEDHQDYIRQTTGQLMGNPLSFSTLCIGNLATFLHSYHESRGVLSIYSIDTIIKNKKIQEQTQGPYEPYQRILKNIKNSLKLLINGDDAYAHMKSLAEMELHSSISNEYGLKVNQKTIRSKTIAQINSVMVSKRGKVDYFNLAIYNDNNIKSGGKLDSKNIGTNAELFNWEVFIRSNYLFKFRRFLKTNHRYSVFLPVSHGGNGLKTHNSRELLENDRYTRFQLIQLSKKKININPSYKSLLSTLKTEETNFKISPSAVYESEFCLWLAKKLLYVDMKNGYFEIASIQKYTHNFEKYDIPKKTYTDLLNDYLREVVEMYKYNYLVMANIQLICAVLYQHECIRDESYHIVSRYPDISTIVIKDLYDDQLYIYPNKDKFNMF